MLLPIALSVASYAASWIVLSFTLWSETSIHPFTRMLAILTSGIVALWEGVGSVLAVPFLLQWTLMQVASAVALVAASKLRCRHSRKHLGIAIGACVVASYSSGNGLLLWLLVIAIAIVVGARRQAVVALSSAAFLAIGVYFIHYHLAGPSRARQPHRLSPLLHPVRGVVPQHALRRDEKSCVRRESWLLAVHGRSRPRRCRRDQSTPARPRERRSLWLLLLYAADGHFDRRGADRYQ